MLLYLKLLFQSNLHGEMNDVHKKTSLIPRPTIEVQWILICLFFTLPGCEPSHYHLCISTGKWDLSVDLVQGTAKPLNEGKKVLSTLEDLEPNCSNEIGLLIEFRESVCSEPGRLQIHSEHTFSLDIGNNLSPLETRTKEPTSILGFLMRMGMGQRYNKKKLRAIPQETTKEVHS